MKISDYFFILSAVYLAPRLSGWAGCLLSVLAGILGGFAVYKGM